jgi:hemerythrin-like domain-containing protein
MIRNEAMANIINLLLKEHGDIERMLQILEDELSAFDRQQRPDHQIVKAVISYLQDYPDGCHHPKEDMVFDKLRARDPVAAEKIGNLEAEHQEEARSLQHVADMVRKISFNREAVPRQTFEDAMRDFIRRHRTHMATEERFFFPIASAALRAEDWADIDLKWSYTKDSLFSVAMEEKCESLRDRLLYWAHERRH